jgi:CBS domain-containing protein
MMDELVRDIMTKNVVTISSDKTALDAAKLMAEKGISSLIVVKNGNPEGIITERDFIKKICVKELQVAQIKIINIMSKIQTIAEPDTPIEVAVQRMVNRRIRRLPILQDGRVVGIITVTDLARHLRTILLIEGALSSDR